MLEVNDLGPWIIQLLSFGATAGVISGLLTHYLSGRQLERQRKIAAAYTAIRLAVTFEHFAHDCSGIVSKNDNAESSDGAAGEPVTKMPKLEIFPPDDEGWKGLPPDLVDDALSFHQRIKAATSIIVSACEHAEHSDAVKEATEQCVLLGSRAWELGTKLRTAYGFKPLILEFPFQENLLEKRPAIVTRRKAFGSRG